jgi:hypothetical protein
MRNTEKSFHWIVSILNKHQVPFVISGGFAAKIYGSPRALNDIDIDIPEKHFDLILKDIKPYIIYGPSHYLDERWDLQLITLNHKGQEIDLSSGDTLKICDARTGIWQDMPSDFENVEHKKVFGIMVPVIKRDDLINYKSMLSGEHQKIDIQAIQEKNEN